jgi:hypothetical protein
MIAFADQDEITAPAAHKCVRERPLKIVFGDIAVTRRANHDGILPVIINNKVGEICSPQLQPNGRDRAPTPDLPFGTPMLINQHGAYKINVQLPRIAGPPARRQFPQ